MTRVALVPGVLALLPEYAGIEDPVAELRAAALGAVGWLGREVTVLAGAQGARVADHLLDTTARSGDEPSYLVVGNGSAKRTEKAPGHFDERAEPFDLALGESLRGAFVFGGPMASNIITQAQSELKSILDDPKHTRDEVEEKIAALRKARAKARADFEAAQRDLLLLLTPSQEAILLGLGYLE